MSNGKLLCTSCGAYNVGNQTVSGEEGDGSIILRNVKSAKEDRLSVGPFNRCWGGGIVKTSTTLLGGMPGAGKSTMLLQMCDLFAKVVEGEVLYIASEEDLPAIKMRAERLQLERDDKVRMLPAMSGVANVGAILQSREPKAVIVDSLQGLFGKDADDCTQALDTLKKFAVLLQGPVIIVSQVTKDGDYAGQMSFQHHVDCLMFLTPDEEREEGDDEEAERTLWVKKNRYGRAFVESHFAMTEFGLFCTDEEDES